MAAKIADAEAKTADAEARTAGGGAKAVIATIAIPKKNQNLSHYVYVLASEHPNVTKRPLVHALDS